MGEAPDRTVSEMLARMGAVLYTEQTVDALLELLVTLATSAVGPGADASVTLHRGGKERTAAASSEGAEVIDEVQYSSGRGPCLTAARAGELQVAELDPHDDRWPEFSAAALAHGFARSVSAPLSVGDAARGALNIYLLPDRRLSERDLETVRLLAKQASIVLSNAVAFMEADQLNEQLREAIATRETIGQATGILMTTEKIGPEEAFDVMRRASQRSNRKLREIAQEIVDRSQRRRPGG